MLSLFVVQWPTFIEGNSGILYLKYAAIWVISAIFVAFAIVFMWRSS
jgi:hypothetical protein